MSTTVSPTVPIVYPESDGKPMADNNKQMRWILLLYAGIDSLFRHDEAVFVGGNMFWYPVENEPKVVAAPDVFVAFGRPPGDRSSYYQWEENDVAPQVVFEVLSPGNTYHEMIDKFHFYEDHGVEEYYVYDPESNRLDVYERGKATLRRVALKGYVSNRLKIRFDFSGDEMAVFGPNGRFLPPREQAEENRQLQDEKQQLQDEKQQLQDEKQQLQDKYRQVEDTNQQLLDARQTDAARIARMAELTRKLLAGQASDEERAELARLAATT